MTNHTSNVIDLVAARDTRNGRRAAQIHLAHAVTSDSDTPYQYMRFMTRAILGGDRPDGYKRAYLETIAMVRAEIPLCPAAVSALNRFRMADRGYRSMRGTAAPAPTRDWKEIGAVIDAWRSGLHSADQKVEARQMNLHTVSASPTGGLDPRAKAVLGGLGLGGVRKRDHLNHSQI